MNVRAVARINLAAVERNCATLVRASPNLCAVVKADAYGHGALACARAALAAGATSLAVAAAEEASELRAGGIEAPIIVLGVLTRAELDLALRVNSEVVAWSDALIDWVVDHGGGRVHVKIDSGMGRLGTRDGALADKLVERIAASGADGLELAGVMTHFATADDPDQTYLREQIHRFASWVEGVRKIHPDVCVHAENSAALLATRLRFDMARCGVALYGLDPFGGDAHACGLEPALELCSWVGALKPLAVGESAGYGRRFVASKATELGVIPVGYADGVRRVLSNNADVLVGGARRPVVGTISMDSLTIDLGARSGVSIGAPAVLIGPDGTERITAEEIAQRSDTINYEVTCGIGRRVPRRYHRDGAPVPAHATAEAP